MNRKIFANLSELNSKLNSNSSESRREINIPRSHHTWISFPLSSRKSIRQPQGTRKILRSFYIVLGGVDSISRWQEQKCNKVWPGSLRRALSSSRNKTYRIGETFRWRGKKRVCYATKGRTCFYLIKSSVDTSRSIVTLHDTIVKLHTCIRSVDSWRFCFEMGSMGEDFYG